MNKPFPTRSSWNVACAGVLCIGLLSGCGSGASGLTTAASGGTSGVTSSGTSGSSSGTSSSGVAGQFQGVVHGGQAPIVGATVALWEVGPAGTPPTAAIATATTTASGTFSFPNLTAYGATGACTSAASLVYLVASGGNPGAGTNTAINLMAAVGPCGSLPSYAVINELTTVAAVYALNGFSYQSALATSPPGGLSGCVDCTLNTTSNMTQLNGSSVALTNAFETAALLADVATGTPATWLPTTSQCAGTTPPANCSAVERLDALANSVAACVNSTGGTSLACAELFDCALPGATFTAGTGGQPGTCSGGSGTVPADTLAATLLIARNPGVVAITGIYDTATQYLQFSPSLAAAPTDWTLALNFNGGGLAGSLYGIAIDSSGNAWVTNIGGNSVVETGPNGKPLSPATGFTGGGQLNQPAGIAIDGSGDIWVANTGGNSVTELSSTGALLSTNAFTGGGLSSPYGIAIDAGGDAWVANYAGASVTELQANGTAISPAGGFTGGMGEPTGIAIEPASGTVWVTNQSGNSATELSSAGAVLATVGAASGVTQLSQPTGIAIDASGDVWIANSAASSITELSSTGTLLSSTAAFTGGGLNSPYGIAIDAGGNVWVADQVGNSVTELSSSGTPLSPATGFTGAGLSTPLGIAIDAGGNVWVANYGATGITELIGAAVPSQTPIAATL